MATNIYEDHLELEGAIYFMLDEEYFIIIEFYSNSFYSIALYHARSPIFEKERYSTRANSWSAFTLQLSQFNHYFGANCKSVTYFDWHNLFHQQNCNQLY